MTHPSARSGGAQRDVRGLPEAEKYDRGSREEPGHWYDPECGLQRLERLRFPYFRERLGPFAGRRVLDVGCGGGILAEDLARDGARVVGVDPSGVTLEVARAHAAGEGFDIEYRHGFAEDMGFEAEFDLVFAVDVLEHVEDLERTLDAVARALRPGGGFGFLTHNQTLEAFTEIIWKWEYAEGSSKKGGHDFHKFIAPEELRERLGRRGLEVADLRGIAWGDEPRLTDDLSVSYLGVARKGS